MEPLSDIWNGLSVVFVPSPLEASNQRGGNGNISNSDAVTNKVFSAVLAVIVQDSKVFLDIIMGLVERFLDTWDPAIVRKQVSFNCRLKIKTRPVNPLVYEGLMVRIGTVELSRLIKSSDVSDDGSRFVNWAIGGFKGRDSSVRVDLTKEFLLVGFRRL